MNAIFPRQKNGVSVDMYDIQDIYLSVSPKVFNGHITLMSMKDKMIQNFIYAIKYENYRDGGEVLGEIINDALTEEYLESEKIEKMKYVLCCIPPTNVRRMHEQYDHLDSILQFMCKKFDISDYVVYEKNILQWNRDIKRQSSIKNRKERLSNVSDAMDVKIKILKNTVFFVIDDVTTTGATLNEAKRTLMDKGAAKVITIALARAK